MAAGTGGDFTACTLKVQVGAISIDGDETWCHWNCDSAQTLDSLRSLRCNLSRGFTPAWAMTDGEGAPNPEQGDCLPCTKDERCPDGGHGS